jgi:hypothetical protein
MKDVILAIAVTLAMVAVAAGTSRQCQGVDQGFTVGGVFYIAGCTH